MTITIEKAKQEALALVEDSISKECMFSAQNQPDEDEHDWSKGDPETPATIANLVSIEGFKDENTEVGCGIIEAFICDKYPQFA